MTAEIRAIGGNFYGQLPSVSVSGRNVEGLSAALACTNVVAENLAALPVAIYSTVRGAQRTLIDRHPLYGLVDDGVNARQTWVEWLSEAVASILLRGNALAEIVRDGSGNARELVPLSWDSSSLQVAGDGRLIYTASPAWNPAAPSRRFLSGDVLHLRDRSDDGVVGRSRISRALGAVQVAASTQDFARNMWSRGAHPSGMVTSERSLTPEGLKALRTDFEHIYSGTSNAGRVIVVDGELKFTPMSVNPEDAELISSRRFGVEEISRIFGVPPLLIGDLTNSSFNNAETMFRVFAQTTLQPWCSRLGSSLSRSLLPIGQSIVFDLSGLQRGDPNARWQANATAVNAGILTPNEIRRSEGYNPVSGGDSLRMPSGSVPAPAPAVT